MSWDVFDIGLGLLNLGLAFLGGRFAVLNVGVGGWCLGLGVAGLIAALPK